MLRILVLTGLIVMILASCVTFPFRAEDPFDVEGRSSESSRLGGDDPGLPKTGITGEVVKDGISSGEIHPVLVLEPMASPPEEPYTTVMNVPTAIHTPTIQPTLTLLPYPQAVALEPVVDVWDDPIREGDTWHRQTQLLMGEKVLVVRSVKVWSEILAVQQPSRKHVLGYPGWVRSRMLAAVSPGASSWLVVTRPIAAVYVQPDTSAQVIARLYLDTRLPALEQSNGWVFTALPDGRKGWLHEDDLRLASDPEIPFSPDSMQESARSLLGAPYLWGGTTIKGIDCSGFVYRLYHAHGILLARDAQDQALLGQPVSQAELRTGDLLFFTSLPDGRISHVGLYSGNKQLIDAELEGGLARRTITEVLSTHRFVSAIRLPTAFSSHPPSIPVQKSPASLDR